MTESVRPPESSSRLPLWGIALLGIGIAVLYRDVVPELVRAWGTDDNYSHGYLIPPIALYLIWERRHKWFAAPTGSSLFGLVVVIASLGFPAQWDPKLGIHVT